MKTKEIIETSLNKIFSYIGVKPEINIEEDDNVYSIAISGNNLNYLIGFRGQSLEALQTLIKQILFRKTGEHIILTIDINEYKDKKVEKLQDLARGFIDKVRFFEKEIELPRMNPWERRQIHIFVSEYDDVESESIGEGEDRRVVLKPKKKEKKKSKKEFKNKEE
ncbi:KH domain-containing protein [candidate division WWE3 bacterium]|uniref:KH domain-containing protein n=1 Tax=candidate division WWE3 bacterium TaxID=2053526 RepID=A0A7X9E6P5_UNCKA|nr:KH domain-containing protein [candidate division WWE3 bacterium]